MQIKRIVYITAFVFLGILLQQLLHAGLEMAVIHLLVLNFARYSLGLSWNTWYAVHSIASIVLLVGGIAFGWWQGVYWWSEIYVYNRRRRLRKGSIFKT